MRNICFGVMYSGIFEAYVFYDTPLTNVPAKPEKETNIDINSKYDEKLVPLRHHQVIFCFRMGQIIIAKMRSKIHRSVNDCHTKHWYAYYYLVNRILQSPMTVQEINTL